MAEWIEPAVGPDVKHADEAMPHVQRNADIKRDEATGLPTEPLRHESINEPPGSNVYGKTVDDLPDRPSQRPPLPQPKPPIAKPDITSAAEVTPALVVTPAAEMPESPAQQQLRNP
jgi:hypothetical protein